MLTIITTARFLSFCINWGGTHCCCLVFTFHLSNETVFLVQQGQNGKVSEFAVPKEYYVTQEDGSCEVYTSSSDTETLYSIGSFQAEASSNSVGVKQFSVNGKDLEKAAVLARRRLEDTDIKSQDATSNLNFKFGGTIWGNSDSSKNSYAAVQKGFSKQTQTTLKRAYYTAGLRLDRLIQESFTLEFRMAVEKLVSSEYNFYTAAAFIYTYGNFGKSVNYIQYLMVQSADL